MRQQLNMQLPFISEWKTTTKLTHAAIKNRLISLGCSSLASSRSNTYYKFSLTAVWWGEWRSTVVVVVHLLPPSSSLLEGWRGKEELNNQLLPSFPSFMPCFSLPNFLQNFFFPSLSLLCAFFPHEHQDLSTAVQLLLLLLLFTRDSDSVGT